jgi:hypothetical protein
MFEHKQRYTVQRHCWRTRFSLIRSWEPPKTASTPVTYIYDATWGLFFLRMWCVGGMGQSCSWLSCWWHGTALLLVLVDMAPVHILTGLFLGTRTGILGWFYKSGIWPPCESLNQFHQVEMTSFLKENWFQKKRQEDNRGDGTGKRKKRQNEGNTRLHRRQNNAFKTFYVIQLCVAYRSKCFL